MSGTKLRTMFGKKKKCNEIRQKMLENHLKKEREEKHTGKKNSSHIWQTAVIHRGMYRLALKIINTQTHGKLSFKEPGCNMLKTINDMAVTEGIKN